MARTRNQRRTDARKRRNLREADKANTQRELAKQAIISRNLASGLTETVTRERSYSFSPVTGKVTRRDVVTERARFGHSIGLVTDYSPTRNPLSYTRPMRFSHGVAD